MTSTIEQIFPEYIRLDGDTQPRAEINKAICDEYGEQMKAGDKFPPIDVFFDGTDYWLADGFHRIQAYVMALPGEAIECNVFQGTQQDAQWHSYSVNKAHGLRRNPEDKERAVKAALGHPKCQGLSDAAIAEHIGVHRNTVLKIRRKFGGSDLHTVCKSNDVTPTSEAPKSQPRTGRDGRTINIAGIGKHPASKAKRKTGKKGNRISPDAAMPVLGHSLPNPMISLSLPPNNPVIAAATIFKLFNTDFVRTLVAELTQRLQGDNQ